jgi:hypothetical protein
MKTKNLMVVGAVLGMGIIGSLGVMGADATNVTNGANAVAGAVASGAGGVGAATNWALMLIPVVVPILIAVIKLFLPKLPKLWIPILAPVLGAVCDMLMGGAFGSGTIMGAIAGSAGVGLREIVDQVKKQQGQG